MELSDRAVFAHELADQINRIKGFDPDSDLTVRLDETLGAICTILPVDGAGLMVLDAEATLRYAAATDETGRLLEAAQADTGVGPCVDALLNDEVTDTPDIATDPRWPELVDRLVPHGIRAIHGVPVRVGGMTIGSLNTYRREARHMANEEADAMRAFTTVIEGVIAAAVLARRQDRLVEELQAALDSRIVIERAIGVLIGRHDIVASEAFARIRNSARHDRRKAAAVANDLLDGSLRL